MKRLRAIHLYIGCLFTPALAFFVVTGCWQTFRFNDARKDGTYTPPILVKMFSQIHTHQWYIVGMKHSSYPFQLFVLAMSCFLLTTMTLGILLALQASRRPWVVWACLLAGIVVPVLLLRFG